MTRVGKCSLLGWVARGLGWCLALALVLGAGRAGGQSPLARFVPNDVGLVLEVSHLTRDLGFLASASLGKRLRAYPPFVAWRAKHAAQEALYAAQIQRHLGVSPGELWEILLGQHVLLAIWPEIATSVPGHAPMALLAETADPAQLQDLVSRSCTAVSQAGGQVRIQARQVGSTQLTVYTVSTERAAELHLTTVGKLALATNDLATLERVVSLYSNAPAAPASLATLPAYLAAHERFPNATLRLFISPRSWDPLIAQPDSNADLHGLRDRQMALKTWQAIRYVVAGIQLNDRVYAFLAASWQADALPDPLAGALGALHGRAVLARHIPDDAILAGAVRLDIRQLLQELLPHLADAGEAGARAPRADAGTMLLLTLASHLGPEAVAFVAPMRRGSEGEGLEAEAKNLRPRHARGGALKNAQSTGEGEGGGEGEGAVASNSFASGDGDESWFGWVIGLQTQALDDPQGLPLAAVVHPLLRTALQTRAAILGDESPTKVHTSELRGLRLTTVSVQGEQGEAATRLEVSFTAQGDVFWATSHRWALEQALDLPGEACLQAAPWWAELARSQVVEPGQFFYANVAALRNALRRSPQVVNRLLGMQRLDAEAARRGREELLALAALCDRLLLAGVVNEQGLVASLTITADDASPAGAE